MARVRPSAVRLGVGAGGILSNSDLCKTACDTLKRMLAKLTNAGAGSLRPPPLPHLPAIAATATAIPIAATKGRFARLGLIHLDISALEFAVIELHNGLRGFFRIRHFG